MNYLIFKAHKILEKLPNQIKQKKGDGGRINPNKLEFSATCMDTSPNIRVHTQSTYYKLKEKGHNQQTDLSYRVYCFKN